MPRIPIDDLDDPPDRDLSFAQGHEPDAGGDQFVVEGERLVERLVASRFPVVSLLVANRHEPKLAVDVPEGCPCMSYPTSGSTRSSGFRFTGVCWRVRSGGPGRASRNRRGRERRLFLAICPKLSNPENLGAIARIGDVFGIDAILAGPECPDPLSRRVSASRWGPRCGSPSSSKIG